MILQIAMIVIAGLPVIITNEFWQTTFKNFGSIGEGKLWQDIHLADLLSVIVTNNFDWNVYLPGS